MLNKNGFWQEQNTSIPDGQLNWQICGEQLDADEPVIKLTKLQEIQEERRRRSYNKQLKRRK